MITVAAILGPTASGKSRLGIDLALRMNGEILSIDSRQAYRRIDIGTAKPSAEERSLVPHRLIDILDLEEKSDAQKFAMLAHAALRDAASRGKLPILVGGSGLYFRAIERGLFDIRLEAADRIAFAESIRDVSNESLHGRLQALDPESALRIHRNDRYRLVRALEVRELTGTSLSEHVRRRRLDPSREEIAFVKIGLDIERGKLHRNIAERAKRMFERGWAGEVERLLAEGADPEWPGMKTLGYPQVLSHVRGEVRLDETVERVSELTRQYAKRQVTWFRKEPSMHWLMAGENGLIEAAAELFERRGSG
ncbi:MAG: tRNA (adenosine(37)-N6)-dimethylallyltransferase MiaA [Candidatus Krumholzibacteriia bacterium]